MGKKGDVVVCALGALIMDNSVFLVRRAKDPHAGLWNLPGGKLEKGETLSEACVREFCEETELHVSTSNAQKIYVQEDHGAGYEIHVFQCQLVGEYAPHVDKRELDKYGLYSIGEELDFLDKISHVEEKLLPYLKKYVFY